MKIKAVIIAILLVFNLGLLTAVILSVFEGGQAWAGTAQAQALPGSPKYAMVTGRLIQDGPALYVLNLERRLLAVFTFSPRKKKLTYNGRVNLAADFR